MKSRSNPIEYIKVFGEVTRELEENKKAIADATGVRTKEKAEYTKESANLRIVDADAKTQSSPVGEFV